MRFLSSLVLVALLTLSGCLDGGNTAPDNADADLDSTITRVQDRAGLDFVTDPENHPYSRVLEAGPHGVLDGVGKVITVDMPVGTGLPTADIHMGLFFPDIDGCDWDAEDLPEECRLPVVADIGPYYGEPALGDVHATEPANRLGGFLIENLVPHGYVIAQVSVTGTGDSTGCMDLMGPVEQAGVQESVRFLGNAPWSNGAVGLIGRSYDGSTPWEAAMAPDLPELKTVVPISGLYGQLDLMWRNGSAEFRAPGVLWGLYYAFTYTGNDPVTGGEHFDPQLLARQVVENSLCADTQTGAAQAAAAYVYGGDPAAAALEEGSYWEERSFREEVLANYEGSVYFIHGMQDWNVDPHMAFPFYQELEAKGLEMKGLFGQWGHHYPDRVSEHPENLRWDWAQDLLEWFDHYLKGTGDRPQLHVEIEDDANQWRIETTWPPADLAWKNVGMDAMTQTSGMGSRIYGVYDPFTGGHQGPNNKLTFDVGALSDTEDTRIAGLPLFHVTVTPEGPGGMVYAELRDATDDRRIGHAIMDLRYHAGGTEMQVVTPMQPIVAKMEFFPLDALVPAGNELELVVATGGRDYMPSVVNNPVTIHADETSVLKLPLVQRDGSSLFTPPGWDEADDATE